MGKRAFGWDSDMTAYGPKAHLGSAVINWAPYYIKATGRAGRQLGHGTELVGREGGRHRPGVHRRGCARRHQGQGWMPPGRS